MLSDDPSKAIPHRAPFVWVSRLMERTENGDQGLVEFDVTEDLEVLKGHFPGNPIFPGVLQMEAAAQACMWIQFGIEDPKKHEGYYASVDSFKFKRMVRPGDTLKLECRQIVARASLQKWGVVIKTSQGDLCSKGEVWMKLGEAKA